MEIVSCCKDCTHIKVCKYTQDVQDLSKSLEDLKLLTKYTNQSIIIRCKFANSICISDNGGLNGGIQLF